MKGLFFPEIAAGKEGGEKNELTGLHSIRD
jgi:hypothetical protein